MTELNITLRVVREMNMTGTPPLCLHGLRVASMKEPLSTAAQVDDAHTYFALNEEVGLLGHGKCYVGIDILSISYIPILAYFPGHELAYHPL